MQTSRLFVMETLKKEIPELRDDRQLQEGNFKVRRFHNGTANNRT